MDIQGTEVAVSLVKEMMGKDYDVRGVMGSSDTAIGIRISGKTMLKPVTVLLYHDEFGLTAERCRTVVKVVCLEAMGDAQSSSNAELLAAGLADAFRRPTSGPHTSCTLLLLRPSMPARRFRICAAICSCAGQPGEVSVRSMFTFCFVA